MQEGKAAVSKRLADAEDHLRDVRAEAASARATVLERDAALAQLRRELDKARLDVAKAHEEIEEWRRRAGAAGAAQPQTPAVEGIGLEAAPADDDARSNVLKPRHSASVLISKMKAAGSVSAAAASMMKTRRRASSSESVATAAAVAGEHGHAASNAAVDDVHVAHAQCAAAAQGESADTARAGAAAADTSSSDDVASAGILPAASMPASALVSPPDRTRVSGSPGTQSLQPEPRAARDLVPFKAAHRRRSAMDASAATTADNLASGSDAVDAEAVTQLARTRAALEQSKAAGDALREEVSGVRAPCTIALRSRLALDASALPAIVVCSTTSCWLHTQR